MGVDVVVDVEVDVGVGVEDGLCVGVAVAVADGGGVKVGVLVGVAVELEVGVRVMVGVNVGAIVRLGEAVGVRVAGRSSARAKPPSVGVYPQTVPWVGSRSIRICPVSGVQFGPSRRRSLTAAGVTKSLAAKRTQSCLVEIRETVVETAKNHAVWA